LGTQFKSPQFPSAFSLGIIDNGTCVGKPPKVNPSVRLFSGFSLVGSIFRYSVGGILESVVETSHTLLGVVVDVSSNHTS